jgi:hypothetical protein
MPLKATPNNNRFRSLPLPAVTARRSPCRIHGCQVATLNIIGGGENRHGRIGGRVNACGGRNRRKCRHCPKKPNKFCSAHSAPRSAPSAFSEEDIPARTVPRFTPGYDNSHKSG